MLSINLRRGLNEMSVRTIQDYDPIRGRPQRSPLKEADSTVEDGDGRAVAPRLLLAASGSRKHVRPVWAVVSRESANAHKLLKRTFRGKLRLKPDPKLRTCDFLSQNGLGTDDHNLETRRHAEARGKIFSQQGCGECAWSARRST
jgi:hypothetical protein